MLKKYVNQSQFILLGILLGQVIIASEKEDYSADFQEELSDEIVLRLHSQESTTTSIDTRSEKSSPYNVSILPLSGRSPKKRQGLWLDEKEDAMIQCKQAERAAVRGEQAKESVVMLLTQEQLQRRLANRYQKIDNIDNNEQPCLHQDEIDPLLQENSDNCSDNSSNQEDWSVAAVFPEPIRYDSKEQREEDLISGSRLRLDVSSASLSDSQDSNIQSSDSVFLDSNHFKPIDNSKRRVTFQGQGGQEYRHFSNDTNPDDNTMV